MKKLYRQGDVMLRQDDKILKTGKVLQSKELAKSKRLVLAFGEATGHAHAFYGEDAELVEATTEVSGKLLEINVVNIGKTADLKHEEHSTITFAPGQYEQVRQMEYHPEELRLAID